MRSTNPSQLLPQYDVVLEVRAGRNVTVLLTPLSSKPFSGYLSTLRLSSSENVALMFMRGAIFSASNFRLQN